MGHNKAKHDKAKKQIIQMMGHNKAKHDKAKKQIIQMSLQYFWKGFNSDTAKNYKNIKLRLCI